MSQSPSTEFTGNFEVVRLSASLLDHREGDCGDFAAVKARPQLWSRVSEKRRYAPWETFPLGLVMDVLDAVEFEAAQVDEALTRTLANTRSTVHPGVASWVWHACHTYLEVSESLAATLASEGVELHPERNPRIVQGGRSAAEMRSLTVWGRWYGSPDGTTVEFRRMRLRRPLGSADRPSTQAMAYVAAVGRQVEDPSELYRAIPVPVRPVPVPERVRVVEIGLTTGTDEVLLDTTDLEEIRGAYASNVRPATARLLAGGDRIPGQHCAECKARASCGDLAHAPGLLGLDDRGTHRRTWSITTSRYYQVCPAQAHLRELRLPGDWETSPAAERGQHVHAWLETAHTRGRPCTLADLPESGADDCGLADALMEREEYHRARPYLLRHLEVCPLNGPGEASEVRPEPKVAAYDARADVVVLAHPDLLRRVDGRLVYREQKTSAVPRGITTENALEMVPQLALAVCLITAGVFEDTDGLVELEQLTPASAEVLTFDAADPAIVSAARAVVLDRIRPWHRDVAFRATPGSWCRFCPVARWCPDASRSTAHVVDGLAFDPLTGEILASPGRLDGRVEAIAATLADPDPDDEPPY
ncbi:PD-(D/E)XK nuclease family protein [Streptosporangium sp. NBC_01755]|uniref:PD-(D/E)XK nuclease family protein n=1 Tax=unclassified Streptosporangium TaxID=2632669 RepID=UPI002DD7EF16|nr:MULTISPECIES: PD-(D/E)XK nuclease family protein [unclassified Streptosporangium]WSA23977.1 PD-(D/E)XK nuclease family protein [Streptosporangium sp. NBC_01810]WSC97947.1 PD-(D/E)XK nuclease family protein [Streptosporangium sp. NBC_01755]